MADKDELLNLPSFVACQVRCRTAREEYMEAEEAVAVDEDEGTVTVTRAPDVHRHVKRETVLLDRVYDGEQLEAGEERDRGFVEELWGELENPLLDRLELAREAAVVILGTKQSGKSALLLGTKSADDPAFYASSGNGGSDGKSAEVPAFKEGAEGLIARFARYAFEEGFSGKGGVDAIEVTMVHIGGNDHCIDLLAPPQGGPAVAASKHHLRLRFSAAVGTFVQNVSHAIASDLAELMTTLHEVRLFISAAIRQGNLSVRSFVRSFVR